MSKSEYTHGNIAVTMLKTACAMLASTLAMSGYNIVDTFFVGHIGGEEPLAAMGYTFPVVMFVGCIFHGLGTGCMATMAQAVGRGDMEEAKSLVTAGIEIILMSAIVMAAVGIGTADIAFGAMGAKGHTLVLVKQYMNVWFLGCLTCGLNMEGNKLLIGAGHPRLSSAMTVMGMLINAVLDPLLIFGGAECHVHMIEHSLGILHPVINLVMPLLHCIKASGICGAAVATVVSQIIASIVIVAILLHTKLLATRPLPFGKFKNTSAKIIKYAIPAILGMLLFPISNYITTWITSKFGDAVVAGMSAAQKLEGVAFIFPMAFGTTLMPIIAQNYGARLYSRVRGAFKFAISVAFFFLTISALVLFFFGHNFVGYITRETSVQEIMIMYMKIIPWGFAALEITRFGGFALVGCGHPVKDTVLKTVRIVGIMIPLYMLVNIYHWQPGIYYARLLTDLSGGLMFVTAAWRMIHKLPEDGVEMKS